MLIDKWARRWALAVVAVLAATLPVRAEDAVSADDIKIITARYGGPYADAAIGQYVSDLGNKLVSTTPMAGQKFTFTVLNTPVVNAFAMPGGYVFVTRGLLALANNEAELAGVLGHEIGHITSHHVEQRMTRDELTRLGVGLAQVFGDRLGNARIGAFTGRVAGVSQLFYIRRYSRQQEFQADQIGTQTLAKAGYDPHAMATFLSSLGATTRLENRMAGRPEDYNDFSMFADHPRTPDRVDRAVAEAASLKGDKLERDFYLAHIEGLLYGDDPDQGILRGATFYHPTLRLAFDIPEGFQVVNTATSVIAENDDHAGFVFDQATEAFNGSPEEYISKVWAPEAKIQPQHLEINGMAAGSIAGQIKNDDGSVQNVRLVAIRYDERTIYRFVFVLPDKDRDTYLKLFDKTALSFRRLTAEQSSGFKPYRMRIVAVTAGDTIDSLSARLPYRSFKRERFMVLNALAADAILTPGQRVKLVVE